MKTTVAINTGFFATPTKNYDREQLARLQTPVLLLNGGVTDSAYLNSIDNYNLVNMPTALVSNARAGNNGLSLGIRDGSGNEGMMIEGTRRSCGGSTSSQWQRCQGLASAGASSIIVNSAAQVR